MIVFVLQEEEDVIAVFKTKELAYAFANKFGFKDFTVHFFKLREE